MLTRGVVISAVFTVDTMSECRSSATVTYLAAVVSVVISLALGCTLDGSEFRDVARHNKRGVVIGWVSQFGVMPVLAYAIARW